MKDQEDGRSALLNEIHQHSTSGTGWSWEQVREWEQKARGLLQRAFSLISDLDYRQKWMEQELIKAGCTEYICNLHRRQCSECPVHLGGKTLKESPKSPTSNDVLEKRIEAVERELQDAVSSRDLLRRENAILKQMADGYRQMLIWELRDKTTKK